ncbi:MAG: signal recognition particle receptor subunit alpha, partial [Proteobacteria bacterium]|nr:signal recognition particle receptor subunit alpha [Pseudomonadota bacterium]
MLEIVTRGFQAAAERLRGVTKLDEEKIEESLREVRDSLLEADVDLAVVRDFL